MGEKHFIQYYSAYGSVYKTINQSPVSFIPCIYLTTQRGINRKSDSEPGNAGDMTVTKTKYSTNTLHYTKPLVLT